MERKESRHGLELIKFACIKLKGNFSSLFMGAFAMVLPLVLVLLVPYIISIFTELDWLIAVGVAIFVLFIGPIQIGYIKYFNETLEGKQPKLSRVFSQIKFSVFTLRTVYITTLLMLMYILGGILWMVPAGFAISFFSMILFFLEKYEYPKLRQAFKESAFKMVGNRLALFSYKLIFYLVYFMLFILAGLCMGLIYILSIDSMVISIIVAICTAIVFIFLYTLITVYYHSANQVFFEDVLMYNERKAEKLRKEKEEKLQRKLSENSSQSTEAKENNPKDAKKNNVNRKAKTDDKSKKSTEKTLLKKNDKESDK